MLKSKKPLKAKTSLKSKTELKKSKRTIPQLVHKADMLFSRAIRLRDSQSLDGEWHGQCITCNRRGVVAWIDEKGTLRFRRGWDNGHFIGRGDFNLRYDEENTNLQCSHCNAWRDKESMLEAYRNALDDKYGVGTYAKLKRETKLNKRTSLTKIELEQVIQDSAEEVKFYLALGMVN